jgi:hypothetical protein
MSTFMRIFKNQWFTRFAAKEGITDGELKDNETKVSE